MEATAHTQVLLGAFAVALVLGAVAQKTHFCTLGAVSDWVNMGATGRMRSWFLAIAVAIAGAVLLETLNLIALTETRPPYRSANFAWLRYLLGGLMFGVGMALASGCTTKNLLRFGGGNLKALIVVIVVGGCAYLMTKTNFYALVFLSWMQPLGVNLAGFDIPGQDIGSLLTGLGEPAQIRLGAGAMLVLMMLFQLLRCPAFRTNWDQMIGGLVVGFSIVLGWYLTGGSLGQAWIEDVMWMDEPPVGVGVQSYTFVNPMGEGLYYLSQAGDPRLLTFGVVAVAGVTVGAFAYSILSGHFHIEWFTSWADFLRHLIGAALMGIGGVLAMGCTIGQGIAGVSTLALGSFMALGAIIFGSATTMKVEYYKMLYADASLWDALLSSWVDLHLLPRSMRRLEAL